MLIGIGAISEFVGIVLIGFPDFLPHAERLSRWLRHHWRVNVNRLRRLVGLRPLQQVISLGTATETNAALRLAVTRQLKTDATVEEAMGFLVNRDQEAQAHINELMRRVDELEEGTARQLEQLREGMETHVTDQLTTALEQYRPLRIIGTLLLAIGVICLTIANAV